MRKVYSVKSIKKADYVLNVIYLILEMDFIIFLSVPHYNLNVNLSSLVFWLIMCFRLRNYLIQVVKLFNINLCKLIFCILEKCSS